jgi:hypothetical protein
LKKSGIWTPHFFKIISDCDIKVSASNFLIKIPLSKQESVVKFKPVLII